MVKLAEDTGDSVYIEMEEKVLITHTIKIEL